MMIMSAITLTTKRQATFPVQVCDDLNLRPGDIIELEPAELAGERVWVLRPQKPPQRPWLGCLAGKTAVTNHSLDAVRASIAACRKKKRDMNVGLDTSLLLRLLIGSPPAQARAAVHFLDNLCRSGGKACVV